MIEEHLTRAEARARGLIRYQDSEPCKRGHPNPERWVSNNSSVEYRREDDARVRAVPLAPGTWSVLRRKW
jgi:hypothetical protein